MFRLLLFFIACLAAYSAYQHAIGAGGILLLNRFEQVGVIVFWLSPFASMYEASKYFSGDN